MPNYADKITTIIALSFVGGILIPVLAYVLYQAGMLGKRKRKKPMTQAQILEIILRELGNESDFARMSDNQFANAMRSALIPLILMQVEAMRRLRVPRQRKKDTNESKG